MNMDKGHVTLLVLLDLSAAFDTVDHTILLGRLQSLLGLRGNALSWFQSYLNGRSQRISVDGTLSDKFELECGVPQGSCLGPLLFTIYVSKLFDIIRLHLPSADAFADDTQLYMSFKPSDTLSEFEAVAVLENCIRDVRAWMKEDMLWLNDGKTEFLLIGSRQQLAKVPSTASRLVMLILHLCRPQGTLELGLTPTWKCPFTYLRPAAVHFTIFTIFVTSGNTSQKSILNS